MALLILALTLIFLDMVSQRWGVASTEGMNSLEWVRRQQWYGFH
jgi:hypothetical protein